MYDFKIQKNIEHDNQLIFMIKSKSSLILFFLFNYVGAVYSGELCDWQLIKDKTEYIIQDNHNKSFDEQVKTYRKLVKDFNNGKLTPTITCQNNYVGAITSIIPDCFTSWGGDIKYRNGKRGTVASIGNLGNIGEPGMPGYILLSFKDKNDKTIKFFKEDFNQKGKFKEGIFLGRRKKNPHDSSGRFKANCNEKSIVDYSWENPIFLNPNWIGTCSGETCTNAALGLSRTYYKISDEYRKLLILKKETRKYKINRLIESEQGSF